MLPGLSIYQKTLLKVWLTVTTAFFYAAYILSKRCV